MPASPPVSSHPVRTSPRWFRSADQRIGARPSAADLADLTNHPHVQLQPRLQSSGVPRPARPCARQPPARPRSKNAADQRRSRAAPAAHRLGVRPPRMLRPGRRWLGAVPSPARPSSPRCSGRARRRGSRHQRMRADDPAVPLPRRGRGAAGPGHAERYRTALDISGEVVRRPASTAHDSSARGAAVQCPRNIFAMTSDIAEGVTSETPTWGGVEPSTSAAATSASPARLSRPSSPCRRPSVFQRLLAHGRGRWNGRA